MGLYHRYQGVAQLLCRRLFVLRRRRYVILRRVAVHLPVYQHTALVLRQRIAVENLSPLPSEGSGEALPSLGGVGGGLGNLTNGWVHQYVLYRNAALQFLLKRCRESHGRQ